MDGCVSKNLFLKVMKVLGIGLIVLVIESMLVMDVKFVFVGWFYNLSYENYKLWYW